MINIDTFNFDDYKNRVLLCANGRYVHPLNSRLGKLNNLIAKLKNSGDDSVDINRIRQDIQIIINEIDFFVKQYNIEQHYSRHFSQVELM